MAELHDPGYWERVKYLARRLNGDGCSASLDLWFSVCCDEHDIAYRTGYDVEGYPVSRAQADRLLRICIQAGTPLGKFSPTSWTYWLGVRVFGKWAWGDGFQAPTNTQS
jgi:hypothetical protein